MKILILTENRHNSIGGIEKYTNLLIDTFHKNNHEVYEYSLNLNPEKIDLYEHNDKCIPLNRIQKNKKLNFIEKRKYINKGIKEINSIYDNYDIIINQISNVKWKNNFYNSDKVIYVQHFNPNFYNQKYIAGFLLQPIIYFGMWLVGIKNPFKKFKNFVTFTKSDEKELKISKNNKYIENIPICSYSKKQIEENKKNINIIPKNNFVYFGRLDNFQKKLKKTQKLFISKKTNLDIYGHGNKNILFNNKFIKYNGYLDKEKLNDVINNYKFNVLLSKYEGFPFSVSESLSNGIPSIISNFSPNSKWIINNNGYLIKNKKEFKNVIDLIKNINDEQYLTLRQNCINFALKNLTVEKFEEKWINFINKIHNNS